MDEIKRRDVKLFISELVNFWRLVAFAAAIVIQLKTNPPIGVTAGLVVFVLVVIVGAYRSSVDRRFFYPKYKQLWKGCVERLERLRKALGSLKKSRVADLQDLPNTVESVADSLYLALRRADIVMHEVATSEGWLSGQNHPTGPPSPDRQAQELYRIADKNIAEYRHHYQAVVSGAQRTEAQAAVFTTTLDMLRMKALGYRLVGQRTEMSSGEFLEAMTEAKMQLSAIDKALEELELTPFPKTIVIVPPDDDLRQQLESATATPVEEPAPVRQEVISTPPPIPPDAIRRPPPEDQNR
jgi:hypothetical protein